MPGPTLPRQSRCRGEITTLVTSEMPGTTDGVDRGLPFAAATPLLAPVPAVILAAQRHVAAGPTAGAVKG